MPTDQTLLEAANAAIQALPPLCRRAFILVRFERKTIDQAALQLQISRRQARLLVYRAFVHVQNELGSIPSGLASPQISLPASTKLSSMVEPAISRQPAWTRPR